MFKARKMEATPIVPVGPEIPSQQNIVYSIIQTEDERAKVFEFMQHVFRLNEPMTKSLGCSEEDTYEFFKSICESGFKGPYSLMACDATTGDVVGISLNGIYEDLTHYGNNNVPITNPKTPLECAEEVRSGPFASRNANRLVSIIEHVESAVREHLADCRRVFKIDILGVNPKFGGRGIGKRLTSEALKLARENACEAVFSCATAKASAHIFDKFGFKTLHSVQFALFYENGQQVYKNLHDGGTEASLKVLRLV